MSGRTTANISRGAVRKVTSGSNAFAQEPSKDTDAHIALDEKLRLKILSLFYAQTFLPNGIRQRMEISDPNRLVLAATNSQRSDAAKILNMNGGRKSLFAGKWALDARIVRGVHQFHTQTSLPAIQS